MNVETDKTEPLLDAMSFLLIPFKIEGLESDCSITKNSIWERCDVNVDHAAFYPHIHKFLIGNMKVKDGEKINPKNCMLYSLKPKWESLTSDEQSISQIFGNNRFAIDKEELADVSFSFMNETSSLASPKLMLYPQTSIGILMLSIKPDSKTINISELTSLNYSLHKIGAGQAPCIQYYNKGKELHPNKKEAIDKLYSALTSYGKKRKQEEGWYLDALLGFMLSEFVGIEFFNETRTHLFTYLQVHEKYQSDELMENFIRIVRCQNKEYQVLPDEGGNVYTQTFKNIYLGSDVEGAAMMTLVNDTSPNFIKEFLPASLLTRYLWIYLLVYIQRHVLIDLTRNLMTLDIETVHSSKQSLSNTVSQQAMLKVNAHFTDISDHTQHNAFYNYCVKQLAIKEYMAETKDKIDNLDVVLQEEIVKQQEEIAKEEKKRARILETLIALLAIAQVFFAAVVLYGWRVNLGWFQFASDIKPIVYNTFNAVAIFLPPILIGYFIYILLKYRKKKIAYN